MYVLIYITYIGNKKLLSIIIKNYFAKIDNF